jgi:DMSO reductase anchor subunit
LAAPAWAPRSSTSAIPSAPGAPPRKWRTSWLSREVIVLPAFMGVVFLYGLAHWLDWHPGADDLPSGLPVDPTAILGVAGTVLAFALFVCTAMIYACLKFLPNGIRR